MSSQYLCLCAASRQPRASNRTSFAIRSHTARLRSRAPPPRHPLARAWNWHAPSFGTATLLPPIDAAASSSCASHLAIVSHVISSVFPPPLSVPGRAPWPPVGSSGSRPAPQAVSITSVFSSVSRGSGDPCLPFLPGTARSASPSALLFRMFLASTAGAGSVCRRRGGEGGGETTRPGVGTCGGDGAWEARRRRLRPHVVVMLCVRHPPAVGRVFRPLCASGRQPRGFPLLHRAPRLAVGPGAAPGLRQLLAQCDRLLALVQQLCHGACLGLPCPGELPFHSSQSLLRRRQPPSH